MFIRDINKYNCPVIIMCCVRNEHTNSVTFRCCHIPHHVQQRELSFHLFYSYALLSPNICHYGRVENERSYFRRVENKRQYIGRVQSAFKAPLKSLKGIYVR